MSSVVDLTTLALAVLGFTSLLISVVAVGLSTKSRVLKDRVQALEESVRTTSTAPTPKSIVLEPQYYESCPHCNSSDQTTKFCGDCGFSLLATENPVPVATIVHVPNPAPVVAPVQSVQQYVPPAPVSAPTSQSFKCDLCGRTDFKSEQGLRTHQWKSHKGQFKTPEMVRVQPLTPLLSPLTPVQPQTEVVQQNQSPPMVSPEILAKIRSGEIQV